MPAKQQTNTKPSITRKSRSGEYVRWRSQVADAYRAAGMVAEGDQFEQCSDPAQFFSLHTGESMPDSAVSVIACSSDPTHHAKALCPSCDYRTCPDCAHRQAARLLDRYMPVMQKHFDQPRPGWRFRKIVFTTSINARHPQISNIINDCYKKLRKLLEQQLKPHKLSECGFVVAHEFGPNGHKLHFHILAYCPYLDIHQLKAAWEDATGWHQVFIEQIAPDQRQETLAGAVAEVLKYTTKFWKRRKNGDIEYIDPALVPVLHKVLHGTRRVRSWGLFYNIAVEETPVCCNVCNSPLTLMSPTEYDIWLETGWLPDQQDSYLTSDGGDSLGLKLANKSPPKIDKVVKWEPLL